MEAIIVQKEYLYYVMLLDMDMLLKVMEMYC